MKSREFLILSLAFLGLTRIMEVFGVGNRISDTLFFNGVYKTMGKTRVRIGVAALAGLTLVNAAANVWAQDAQTTGAIGEIANVDAETLYQTGIRLVYGVDGTKIDEKRGVEALKKAAEAGSTAALGALAFHLGDVEYWVKKAAEKNEPYAWLTLANKERNNGTSELSMSEWDAKLQGAFAELKRRRDAGDVVAALALGDAANELDWSDLLEFQDEREAEAAYRFAAERNCVAGMMRLVYFYEQEKSEIGDFYAAEAVKWVEKAVELGSPSAKVELASWYFRGENGFSKDEKKAFALCLEAAEAGDKYGARETADAYEYGRGVEQNAEKAEEWRKKAGGVDVFTALGRAEKLVSFEKNVGITGEWNGDPVDPEKAKEAFRLRLRAAESGSKQGAWEVGVHYWNGLGVEKSRMNDALGLTRILSAAQEGYGEAVNCVLWLRRGGMQFNFGDDPKASCEELCRMIDESDDPPGGAAAMDFLLDEAGEKYKLGIAYRLAGEIARVQGMTKQGETQSDYYRKGAELGDAPSAIWLGICCETGVEPGEYGRRVEKDEKKAFELYRQASELGSAQGTRRLALCYLNGVGVEKDETKAVEALTQAVEARNVEAALALEKYWDEKGDAAKAAEAGLKAAKLRSLDAAFRLGERFRDGNGVEKNAEQAFLWFRRGASPGNEGSERVADCYLEGLGVEKDERAAAAWYRKAAEELRFAAEDKTRRVELYRKAAELGDFEATRALGRMYKRGDGVEKDLNEARRLYTEFAKRFGNASLLTDLGVDAENREFAIECLKAALEFGDPEAALRLGDIYEHSHYDDGFGDFSLDMYERRRKREESRKLKEADRKIADEYNRKALELAEAQGDRETAAKAAERLATARKHGWGVAKDEAAAFEYYRRAFELGEESAGVDVAECYFNGVGVEQNSALGVEWCAKAFEAGWKRAARELGDRFYEGNGVEKDGVKAVEWYRKIAEAPKERFGNEEKRFGLAKLGNCYLNGVGVEKDATKAVEYYRRALDLEFRRDDVGFKISTPLDSAGDAFGGLGVCCENGWGGLEKDVEKAKAYYRKAAEVNSGISGDEEREFFWLNKAAELGDLDALLDVAEAYRYGRGVERDCAKAEELEAKWEELGGKEEETENFRAFPAFR